jgi:TldD protein
MGARKTGYEITGSGRRQDYRFAPTSRMRNTFIAPGLSSFEEMLKDIDYGLYAKNLGGGSVTPGTGSYNFAVNEAYIVRNGRIEEQVKGASLIGTGIETLKRISKVGSELKLAPGTCGSVSGMIPVTVGQPPLLVSKLTVGGKV